MIKTISRKLVGKDFWEVTRTDEKIAWVAHVSTTELRRFDIIETLESQGADMKLVEELQEIAYINGVNSTFER